MLKLFSIVVLRALYAVIIFQSVKRSIAINLIDDYVNNELYLGMESVFRNTTIKDCVWHQVYDDNCSKDVTMILYVDNKKEVYDPSDRNWLQKSSWNPYKKTVILIHGYASGDHDYPIVVLKGAFAAHGEYNLFVVDYSKLGRAPCYVSSVNNVPYISRCIADYVNDLRKSGVNVESCIGHSLGAIICGLLQDYLQFELNKIIALDPALPLIFGRFRLKRSSANAVHVLQTNAGHFGDVGSVGHVNVCVNGGILQPYCLASTSKHHSIVCGRGANHRWFAPRSTPCNRINAQLITFKFVESNLCSHIWAVCYMAQSLFEDLPLIARNCSTYCPKAGIFRFFQSNSSENNFGEIRVINNVPQRATGTYCLDNIYPPYCPKYWNGVGDRRCCRFSL